MLELSESADFIDLLGQTDFGKIICINLYRSLQIKTLNDGIVKSFFGNCICEFNDLVLKKATEEPGELALRVAHMPKVWGDLIKEALFICKSPIESRPSQYSTVVHCGRIENDNELRLYKNNGYFSRKVNSHKNLNDFVRVLSLEKKNFDFGKVNYFWLSWPLNEDEIPVLGWTGSAAERHVALLGLCHYGKDDRLMRAIIPANQVHEKTRSVYRPNALDGIQNPVFLASKHTEVTGPAKQAGTTRNLETLDKIPPEYGVDEWLCASFSLSFGDVVWEFLGTLSSPSSIDDQTLHKNALVQLEHFTPFIQAKNYLLSL